MPPVSHAATKSPHKRTGTQVAINGTHGSTADDREDARISPFDLVLDFPKRLSEQDACDQRPHAVEPHAEPRHHKSFGSVVGTAEHGARRFSSDLSRGKFVRGGHDHGQAHPRKRMPENRHKADHDDDDAKRRTYSRDKTYAKRLGACLVRHVQSLRLLPCQSEIGDQLKGDDQNGYRADDP